MNAGPIVVITEAGPDGTIAAVSRECLHTGRKIANALCREMAAVVMGRSINNLTEEASRYNTDTVYTIDHPLLERYEPELYLAAFLQVYETYNPAGILMGHTMLAQDLAPRIAFRIGTGLVTDCIGFELESDETMLFIKPVYSGNVMASFSIDSETFIVTIRAKSEEPAILSSGKTGRIVTVPVEIDKSIASIEFMEKIRNDGLAANLHDADIIVAGGRGIGGTEGFDMLSELAGILGGAIGSSRPPCDLGWVPPSSQIGQTGEIVKPSIYIAVGISGSTQHAAGMVGSKTVIAINKDSEANIFKIADYGVVGDYQEIIPALRRRMRP
jgi:electron transfer flavoprotein alpha subunit